MSTRRCLWALASIFSSVLLGPAAEAQTRRQEPPAPTTFVEAELALARDPGVYLVLRPAEHQLLVRSRGMTLETVQFQRIAFLRYHRAFGRERGDEAELPLSFEVAQAPDASHRKVIAPPVLRPYPDGDEEAEEESETPIQVTGSQGDPLPTPPGAYQIELVGDWLLMVDQRPPSEGWWARLRYALRDGWQRVTGHPQDDRDLMVFVAAREDAQRIHHLFREGMRILIDPAAHD